jgi:hypothetical protein
VAKAQEAQLAGDRERDLRDLIERKFDDNIAAFARAVAARTKKTPETEKKALYRILEGKPGSRVRWRLGHYAAVLGVSPGPFVAAWEEGEEAVDDSGLPLRLSPREVRAALVTLQSQVARLERQVAHLEQRQQPRKQREVKR